MQTITRVIVVETTIVRPSSSSESPFSLRQFDHAPRETADALSVNRAINGEPVAELRRDNYMDEFRIHASINMLLREVIHGVHAHCVEVTIVLTLERSYFLTIGH